MFDRDPVGPADVQYNDWKGTTALDNGDDLNALYEFGGIDRDEWTIVGVDVFGFYESSWAYLYAAPRTLVKGFDDFARVAAENDGLIPVTLFASSRTRASRIPASMCWRSSNVGTYTRDRPRRSTTRGSTSSWNARSSRLPTRTTRRRRRALPRVGCPWREWSLVLQEAGRQVGGERSGPPRAPGVLSFLG